MNIQEERKTKVLSYIVVAALLLTMWYMLDMALLTFIVTFLFYKLTSITKKRCDDVLPFNLPVVAILSVEYILFFIFTVMFVSEGLPIMMGWAGSLAGLFRTANLSAIYASINPHLKGFLDYLDLASVIQSLGTWISTQIAALSTQTFNFFLNLFIALILAFAMIVEQPKLQVFGERLSNSKASYVYQYLLRFGQNFCSTFGKVMRVQVTIAGINCILSMIFLAFLGFPGIPALGLMLFFLGLVPVAGVIVSLIPLSIIAISIGGLNKLIEVIIMIAVLHAIEAYVLNPKLMSSKTRLPVCLTFIILLVGEHYLKVWGLLIGVPIFIFLMNMLDVDYQIEEEKHQKKKDVIQKNETILDEEILK